MVKKNKSIKKKPTTKPSPVEKNKSIEKNNSGERFNLNYFKENKGVSIFILIFIIVTALLVFSFNLPTISGEEIVYAKSNYEELDAYLNLILDNINLEIENAEYVDPIDDDYLLSIRDDLLWLINKNNELYFSSQNTYLKTTAILIFSSEILYLNEYFSYDLIDTDYDSSINSAKNVTYKSFVIEDEIYNELDNESRIIFTNEIEKINRAYFDFKKNLLDGEKERAYVESKKIIFFYQ